MSYPLPSMPRLYLAGYLKTVTGVNDKHKTPMYEMPLIYVFEIRGCNFGFGAFFFCIGVLGNGILSLAFCPKIRKNCMFQYLYLLLSGSS